MPVPIKIKICGITRTADAEAVMAAGADAVGLNFYPPSPRSIGLQQAQQIVGILGDKVSKIGLFVNEKADVIIDYYERLGLDAIQLHGDETPEFIFTLDARVVIRAFRLDERGFEPIREYLDACNALGCPISTIIVDAHQKGKYGGTGKTVDWTYVAQNRHLLGDVHLILAGGLTPDNVTTAITTAHPDGVDTAGGVESAPGEKAPEAVRAFVHNAREAFSL